MPKVAKLSAGYFARPAMDLIDLFVGSEGTLGVVVAATLRVIPRPRRAFALLQCDGDAQAFDATAALRQEAFDAWVKKEQEAAALPVDQPETRLASASY